MAEIVIHPPEPQEIDETRSMELRLLSTSSASSSGTAGGVSGGRASEMFATSSGEPEGPQHASGESEACIRVRITSDRRTDGSVLVYLPGGTGLVVHYDQLLHHEDTPA